MKNTCLLASSFPPCPVLQGYSLTGGLTGALGILLCMPLGFITLLGLLLKEFIKS